MLVFLVECYEHYDPLYRGSQERALPQHGFRASYLYEHYLEHYIEDTYLCSYEHYDTLCQESLEALPRHGFRACLCSYEHYDIRAALATQRGHLRENQREVMKMSFVFYNCLPGGIRRQ